MEKKYENATIIEKANVYFNGKVNSRTLKTEDGTSVTLGFMQAGEYEFNTNAGEKMSVINGAMIIKLANSNEWTEYTKDSSFEVAANSHFTAKVENYADYSCVYLES